MDIEYYHKYIEIYWDFLIYDDRPWKELAD